MQTQEEMQAELERLRQENSQLKSTKTREIKLKVSDKGGLSVYGIQRFPVTLYKEQWRKVLGMSDQILEFIEANNDKLKSRED